MIIIATIVGIIAAIATIIGAVVPILNYRSEKKNWNDVRHDSVLLRKTAHFLGSGEAWEPYFRVKDRWEIDKIIEKVQDDAREKAKVQS